MIALFFDMAPELGGIAVFGAVAFFFVFAAIAFIAFKMLKRSVKFAVRLAIAAVILVVALAGTTFFFLKGSTNQPRRPMPVQPR